MSTSKTTPTSGTTSRIIFFGTGPVASASLDFIADHFEIEAVITKPRPPHHKGDAPVEQLCAQRMLPLLFAANKQELDVLIKQKKFKSTIGIVVDFGIIISREVIAYFPLGIVNSHFSLLPEWRGADPISYTILSGQPKTGVSLMLIEPALDTGKLITQKTIAVAPKETTGSLTNALVALSNQLILDYLPRYITGEITPRSQPHPDRATYSHKLSKADAKIDWSESADVIERKIRAYQPWPKARALLGQVECIITEADVISSHPLDAGTLTVTDSSLTVACGRGALAIRTLQPLGKKEMPVKAFLAGYTSRLKT